MKHEEFIKRLLPNHYRVEQTDGEIRCKSAGEGVDEDFWRVFFRAVRQHFGKRFQEVYHNTCHNHVDFIIYFKKSDPVVVKQEAFDEVYDKLAPRLNQVGRITTDDAWKFTRVPYSRMVVVFKQIMETMIEQKKAVKIGRGQYEILKPDKIGAKTEQV